MWAETYENELSASNVFAIQDEIASAVVASIAQPYGVIQRHYIPDDFGAYECVLKTYEYMRHANAESHARVRDCLEIAVEVEPKYATAWAWLGFTYIDEYRFKFNPRADPLDRAEEAIARAIELDPNSGTAYLVRAHLAFFRKDTEGFRDAAERAMELSPNDGWTLGMMGEFMSMLGEFEHGLALMRKAEKINPAYPGWYHWPYWRYHFARGEFEKALNHAQQFEMPGFHWQHGIVAACLAHLDRLDEAHVALAEAERLNPSFRDCAFRRKAATDSDAKAATPIGPMIDVVG